MPAKQKLASDKAYNRSYRLHDATVEQLNTVAARIDAATPTEALRRLISAAAHAPYDTLTALLNCAVDVDRSRLV